MSITSGFIWVDIMDLHTVAGTGYQFDYVFDWTILKYPQISSSSRGRVSSCKF